MTCSRFVWSTIFAALFAAVFLSSVLGSAFALSIDTLSITPGSPTKTSTLSCAINASGDGSLNATISWYRNGVLWPVDSESLALVSGISATTTLNGSIKPANLTKGQGWTCQAVLDNGTATTALNSSTTTIVNSPPVITAPTSPTSVTEDALYSSVASTTDADGDPIITYISSDLNASSYNGTELFSIASNGSIDFVPINSQNGNHTVAILAFDGESWGGANVRFTVIPFDDAPTLINPNAQNATVGLNYSLIFVASDEESDALNFSMTSNGSFVITQLTPFSAKLTFQTLAPQLSDTGFFQITVTTFENATPTKNGSVTFTMTVTEPNAAPQFTSVPNANGTQGQAFNYTVTANDSNPTDTLLFSLRTPTCLVDNPWTINTTVNLSTGATGFISVPTLTNAHIACRNITIDISDYTPAGIQRSTTSQSILLNLTNTNDAPVIGEMSYYPGNYLNERNASNLTAAPGVLFTYRVNATDVDLYTYAGDTLTYTSDSPFFTINNSNGAIIFTPTTGMIGTTTINVTVNDSAGAGAVRALLLTVVSNAVPSIAPLGTVTCQEKALCSVNISGSDTDSSENLSIVSNDSLFDPVMKHTWNESQVNRTYTNDEVGTYPILLTVTDVYGATNTSTFTLVINNTNDAPLFDADQNNVSDSIVLAGVGVVGIQKTWTIVATDVDFRNVAENLTFTSLIGGPNPSLFSIAKASNTTATIQFTPVPGDFGNYTVNITVIDIAGETASQNVSFQILNASAPPVIDGVRPFLNGSTQVNSSIVPTIDQATAISFPENTTVVYNLSFTDVDSPLSSIAVYYYDNDTLVATRPGTAPAYAPYYGFFSAGAHNIRVDVMDDRYATDSFAWNVTITNVKRAPVFSPSMANRTINMTTILANEMRFIDPDDDLNSNGIIDGSETNTLVYSAPVSSYFTANFTNNDVTITPTASGAVTFAYTATTVSGGLTASSNVLTYTIFYNPSNTTSSSSSSSSSSGASSRSSSSGGGGSSSVPIPQPRPQPYAIDIIVPKPITIYEDGTVIAPLGIRNTGNISLQNIALRARTDANVSLQFLDDAIPELRSGQMFNTSLAIKGYRFAGTFEVYVTAVVGTPPFNDSAVFYINSIEQGSPGEAVNTKVTQARDLLTQNPVCGELAQLIDQARAAFNRGDAAQGNQLLRAVTDGCTYLKAQRAEELEHPASVIGLGSPTINIALGALLLVLLVTGGLLVAHYARQE